MSDIQKLQKDAETKHISENSPTVINVQLSELVNVIEQDTLQGLVALDPKAARQGDYVSLLRIGPPEPRAPWFPEGKKINSENIRHLQRVLSNASEISVAPYSEYQALMEKTEKVDLTSEVKEIRGVIENLLITYIERGGVQAACMRTYDSNSEIFKQTKADIEKLTFKIDELIDSFKYDVGKVRLALNEIFPTYKSEEGSARGIDIETSYQASISVKVGISFLISLLHYNHDLRKAGAKDPANKFVKTLPGQMKKEDVRYFLNPKIIESATLGAFLHNLGLFHADMKVTLADRLSGEPMSAEQVDGMNQKISAKTLEIFDNHQLLNLPAAKVLLKGLASTPEDLSSMNEDNQMMIDIAQVCIDYHTLTSQRPYRARFNRSQVIEFMTSSIGSRYNRTALNLFFRSLRPYDIGEIVYLAKDHNAAPLYVAKIVGDTEDENNPLWKSMPVVKILAAHEEAEHKTGEIIDLVRKNKEDDNFSAGEIIFFASDSGGPTFQAEVADGGSPVKVKFLKCVTDTLPAARVQKIIGQTIAIAEQKPTQRLWKIKPALLALDTVQTETKIPIEQGDY